VEDDFETEGGQRDGNNPDAPPFLDVLRSPDTPLLNGTSPESPTTIKSGTTPNISHLWDAIAQLVELVPADGMLQGLMFSG
jgi:hypothetical protein